MASENEHMGDSMVVAPGLAMICIKYTSLFCHDDLPEHAGESLYAGAVRPRHREYASFVIQESSQYTVEPLIKNTSK